MGVYMVGSLAAGFSRNINELIVFRGVAGAGGGGIVSMAQIIISDVVSLRERYAEVYACTLKCIEDTAGENIRDSLVESSL